MPLSTFTAFSGITDLAPISPSYVNAKFSVISQNLDQLNTDASVTSIWVRSGSTVTTNPLSLSIIARSYDSGGQFYNVRSYSAVGDGITDDTTALQSAISAANLAGGGTVYIPVGAYLINSTLTVSSNVVLQGSGTSSLIFSASTLTNLNLLTLSSVQSVVIVQLALQASGKSWDADFNRQYGNCILSSACTNVLIQNCVLSNAHNGIMDDNSVNVRIMGNTFFVNHDGYTCIHLRGTSGSAVDGNYLRNSHVTGPVNAIWCYSGENELQGVLIAENHIQGFGRPGFEIINVFGQRNAIISNRIFGSSITSNDGTTRDVRGIECASNSNVSNVQTLIANNLIRNVSRGIRVVGLSSTNTQQHTLVTGNNIERCSELGIHVQGAGAGAIQYVAVTNNVISDVTDLGSATANFGVGIGCTVADHVAISNNVIDNSGKDGIQAFSGFVDGVIIGNVISRSANNGIYIYSGTSNYGITITGNSISSSRNHGINLNAVDRATVVGNLLTNNGIDTTANYAGIQLQTVTDSIVVGNTCFISSSGTLAAYGIQVISGSSIIITNNNVDQARVSGLSVAPAVTGQFLIRDNFGDTRQFLFPYAGSSGTPALAFSVESGLGWYRSAASGMGLSYGQLQLPAGTALAPSQAYSSESSLGWYRSAASTIAQSYGTMVVSTFSSGDCFTSGLSVRGVPTPRIYMVATGLGSSAAIGLLDNANVVRWQFGSNQAIGVGFEINEGDSANNRLYLNPSGGTLDVTVNQVGVAGTAILPGWAYRSEQSLGWYRSAASTMALSYGTFSLNQARLVSVRTNAANSGLFTTLAANEFSIGVGISNATLMFRSGNTAYVWGTSSTTTGT